jgi:hypothetical protein
LFAIDNGLIAVLNKMNDTNQAMVHMLKLSTQLNHNPYATMAQTTDSVKFDIRKNIFLPYSGIIDNKPTCMYSGIIDSSVKCAHILPKSTKMATVSNLGLKPDDVNSPRNMMWLCPGIEDAFDAMKLSFICRVVPGMKSGYVMSIWDDSCLDYKLHENTPQTIRDVYLPDKCLNFDITKSDGNIFEHSVFKRCLANQALWCYHYFNGEFPPSIWTCGDFSSVDDRVRQKLINDEYCSAMSLQREIEREIEEEEN